MTVAARDGVALVEPTQEDVDYIRDRYNGDFEPDEDEKPHDLIKVAIHRLLVVDAATDERLGLVSWHAVMYGATVGCVAWNIGIGLLPDRSARCVRSARLLYSRILEVIEAHDYDVFTKRARVPRWQKAAMVGKLLSPVA